MGKTNAAWHRDNRMPPRATLNQRIAWHLAHAAACGCREMPVSIVDEIRKRGLNAVGTLPRPGGRAVGAPD